MPTLTVVPSWRSSVVSIPSHKCISTVYYLCDESVIVATWQSVHIWLVTSITAGLEILVPISGSTWLITNWHLLLVKSSLIYYPFEHVSRLSFAFRHLPFFKQTIKKRKQLLHNKPYSRRAKSIKMHHWKPTSELTSRHPILTAW